ncbi:hypothetical protein VF03_34290 [Nostoc linckia z2]|nr:hypothetical protein VF03_34290 [Nostoc linckia z2]
MGRHACLHEVADVVREVGRGLDAVLQHDEGLDDFSAQLVGLADGGRKRHGRMLQQRVLDLAGPDAVAGGGDDVVVPAEEVDVAFLVAQALVAGHHPVADELVARRLGATPVFEEHHGVRPLDGDLAALARLAERAVVADDAHRVARHRLADGPRPRHADGGRGGEDEVAFGLAVELVDGEAEGGAAPVVGRRAQRLAARGEGAQHQPVPGARIVDRAQHAQGRRRHEGVADLQLGHQREGFVRVELLELVGHHRHAEME